jgi:uncharacterized protein YndB with AHSA1/START domain
MAQKSEATAFAPVEREVVMTRVFDAPREVVFGAWIDPFHLAQWFGPKMFTTPVAEVDARVGGKWRVVMRAPDGTEYPGAGVYREIVKPERLVFTNDALDKDGNKLLEGLTTVTFEEFEGKTKLTLTTRSKGLVAGTDKMLAGMEEGWSQTLDKLHGVVENGQAENRQAVVSKPTDRELLFTRVFNAPRELVFDVWTDPKHIEHWWGPIGFRTESLAMDVRPGGEWTLVMHGPDGKDYNNTIRYIEVVRPERLVYRHGPLFQSTVTFEDLGGKTKLTMRMLFESGAQRDETISTYHADEGGVQTLGRLAEYLTSLA